jgi:glycoside/pentoside/hexuronide:cation symporter, GPH family
MGCGKASSSRGIGWLRLAAFASPWYPLGAIMLPFAVFLPPLYAEQAGLGLALTGQIFLMARLFDLVIDPFIGAASDRWQTLFGKRKPWIFAGLPIFCVGVYLLFNPPVFAPREAAGLFSHAGLYLLTAAVLTAFGSSLMLVPHAAWSSELADGYDQRSRIMGTNEWVNLVGVLGVAVIAAGLERVLHAGQAEQMRLVGFSLVMVAPLCVAACLLAMPEPKAHRNRPAGGWDFASALLNPFYARLAAIKFTNSIAESITQGLWVFVCASYLGLAHYASTLLAIHIAMGFLAIPLWTMASYRLSKRASCMGALGWRVVLTPLILLLPVGDFPLTALFMALVGLSLGAESSLLRAMVADVIDHHQLRSGLKLAGLFQGSFNVISNFGKALGVGLIYPLLAWLEPAHAGGVSPLLPLFYALVPPLLNGVCILLLAGFRLSRSEVEDIRQRLTSI